ncbi:hypothetical protein Droror1_Dr00021894 [Drosera rotundifolia]
MLLALTSTALSPAAAVASASDHHHSLAPPSTNHTAAVRRKSPLRLPSLSSAGGWGGRRGGGFEVAAASGVASVDVGEIGGSEQEQQVKKYYFVVANAKFMLDEEEHFREVMFERLRLYGERNMEQDFWLVIEPKFLVKFPNITKRLKRPAVALVSTNGPWITFMKLRLDRVLAESYEANSFEDALASTPTKLSFEKPEKWVAPYSKYESGWWESFLLPGSQKLQ